MNWGWLIGLIIQFIVGKILPGAASYAAQRGKSEKKQIQEIAKAMVQLEPQLNYDCLMKVLPDFLDKITDVVREKGFFDYAAMAEVLLMSVVQLVKCQLGPSASASDAQAIDPALLARLFSCGVKWGLSYMDTKDVGASIAGFLGCALGGGSNPPNPPGGGGGNPPVDPPPPGGIDPEKPIFKSVTRCP